MIFSFCLFLFLFVSIGALSVLKKQATESDYLLAGRGVAPWLVALSAVATNNSGYMFIGMIGFTYTTGWSSVWLMIGWVIGDFIGSLLAHKKLRVVAGEQNALSFGGALSSWNGGDFKKLRVLSGILTIVFLGAYAAAQLSAGSKALHVLLGWDLQLGALIGSTIVLIYCLAGGIRASIWTDAAQSFVMILSMFLLFGVAIQEIGGFSLFLEKLDNVSPDYLNWFPAQASFDPVIGAILFGVGWIFAGLGVLGQPHIMVRFMTLDDPDSLTRVRIYYYTWFVLFFGVTIGVGLAARILLPDTQNFDAELALPTLSLKLLSEPMVGLILAGIFAATISTADSLIMSCSAAITKDLIPGVKNHYAVAKASTVFVTMLALGLAWYGEKSVFHLVLIAWSALACAFGPLLILYGFNQKLSETEALLVLISGMVSMFIWRELGLHSEIYEVMPGMLGGLLIFIPLKMIRSKKTARPLS